MKYPHHTHFSLFIPILPLQQSFHFIIMSWGPFVISLFLFHFHPIHQSFQPLKTLKLIVMIIIHTSQPTTPLLLHTPTHFLSRKMDSTSPTYSNALLPNEEEPPHSTLIFRRMAVGRRTPSFSSSSPSSSSWDSSFRSSSFSYSEEFPLFSPSTPLKFKGIPFSWEQIPGIPKHQGLKKKDSSGHLLPLPPAGTTTSAAATKKVLHQEEISPKKSIRFQRDNHDPFFAALVECSKDNDGGDDNDDDEHGSNSGNILKGSSKITRTLSDRFGLINMYSSCKRTCAVSESVVYLPRQSSHYLLNRRSSQV